LLTQEPSVTALTLLDTEIAMVEKSSALISEKARWLYAALVCLVASVALLVSGTLLS
jgi:hypothetical protein